MILTLGHSEKAKLWRQEEDQWLPGETGGQERKGWTEDFQGSEMALHDNRNIGYMSRYIYPNPQKVENQYGALLQTRPRVSMT